MWVIALIGAATGFIESTLAQIYKEPVAKGGFYGGPAYYIRYGLNNKALSILFGNFDQYYIRLDLQLCTS